VSVQSFISTMAGTLDSKGRVCIPAAYRQILTAQDTGGVYLCSSFSAAAIDGFGAEVLERFNAQLKAQDPFFSPDSNAKANVVMSETYLLPFDENGRVRLLDKMIDHAGLTDRVVFVGMGTKFRIWEPARYEEALETYKKIALAAFNGGTGSGGAV
jgi:MraZ protein